MTLLGDGLGRLKGLDFIFPDIALVLRVVSFVDRDARYVWPRREMSSLQRLHYPIDPSLRDGIVQITPSKGLVSTPQ